MPEEGYMTVEEAIAYLGVKRATFWNLVKRHGVPKYKTPLTQKRVFFKREDLDGLRGYYRAGQAENEA